ncbi:MAG: SDR family NAD(P)-dependent oxidoreductase, partial [Pseudomonadota bacterium]
RPLRNGVHYIHCDFSSLESVHHAADEVASLTDSVDVLANNAGIWAGDTFSESKDGIEMTLAVNHLAPYVLTGRLMGLLENANEGRVVNTASFRYADAVLDNADIELRGNYSAEQAYCNSKLYCILFTRRLADLVQEKGITVNCFDPGIVDTTMLRQAFPKKLLPIYPLFRRYFARSPEKGAKTGVYLSSSPVCKSVSGKYYKDFKEKRPRKLVHDEALVDWLWDESVRLAQFDY